MYEGVAQAGVEQLGVDGDFTIKVRRISIAVTPLGQCARRQLVQCDRCRESLGVQVPTCRLTQWQKWFEIAGCARPDVVSRRTRQPEIFAREGEEGFRGRERAVILALPEHDAVVALGGGAICSETNREILRVKGTLVWLDAEPATLAARVEDGTERPLLAGLDRPARERKLAGLREERASAYAQAKLRVDTGGRSPEQVRDAVLLGLGWEDAA